ncbi:MAG: 50S ribosomal protein L33 [Mycoplasmataceae bacterium]|jgi:large subunit ribosomal protein L33|nr:50S ribosomal protein L33 [Mycoplasmataceae bacterium]
MRVRATLICEECNARNYHITVNKYKEKRLELHKYCPKCNKVTVHKETR